MRFQYQLFFQRDEFFLFAGLIALDIVLFAYLASRYQYLEVEEKKDDKKEKKEEEKKKKEAAAKAAGGSDERW